MRSFLARLLRPQVRKPSRRARSSPLRLEQLEDRLTPSTLIPVPNRRDLVFDSVRQVLYITTSNGRVERFDVAGQALLSPWTVGTSLNGADLSLDGNSLYVGAGYTASIATVHKVNLTTGGVTNINFNTGDFSAGGVFDIAISANGRGLASVPFNGSGHTPPLQLDTATDTLSLRADMPGIFFGDVNEEKLITRSASRNLLYLVDTTVSPTSHFTYDPASDRFPGPYGRQLSAAGVNTTAAVNRDGSLLAIANASSSVVLFDRNVNYANVPFILGGNGGLL